MDHKYNLTIFWGLVAITMFSWLYAFFINIYNLEVDVLTARILIITGLGFLPIAIIGSILGDSIFHKKVMVVWKYTMIPDYLWLIPITSFALALSYSYWIRTGWTD